jgi:hypothetical protein
MTKPKFKIGDRLFYKGHLHCVIMDIIQENLSFTYEINMTLNKKNKIVDEWELFENKQQAHFADTTKKRNIKPELVVEPMLFDSEEEAVEYYSKRDKINLIIEEVKQLKTMIANLTEIVMKQNQDVETKGEKSKRRSHLEDSINNLKVGQKKTFFNYSTEKIHEVLTSPINDKKSFNVINFGKKSQVYRYQ